MINHKKYYMYVMTMTTSPQHIVVCFIIFVVAYCVIMVS